MGNWSTLASDALAALRENPRARGVLVGGVAAVAVVTLVSQAPAVLAGPRAAGGPAATGAATPTAGQSEVEAGYGERERSLIAVLESCPWVAPDGTRVTFSDGSVTRGDAVPEPVAVSSVRDSAPTPQTLSDNESHVVTTVETSFSLLMADGSTSIATLTEDSSDEGVSRTLACDALSSSTLAGEAASADLSLDAPEALSALVDGRTEELASAVRLWTQANAPSASVARWLGTARVSGSGDVVECDLALNDVASTRVVATYSRSHGDFSVRRDG